MNSQIYVFKYIIFFAIFFVEANSYSQNTGYYSFIPNETGDIDKDGFDIGYHIIFSQWDLNADEIISEEEFYQIIFRRLDKNSDQNLSIREFVPGLKHLFGPNAYKEVSNNSIRSLSFPEFESALKRTNYFNNHDTNRDGSLTRKELHALVFLAMDLDNNGVIDKKEFDQVREIYID